MGPSTPAFTARVAAVLAMLTVAAVAAVGTVRAVDSVVAMGAVDALVAMNTVVAVDTMAAVDTGFAVSAVDSTPPPILAARSFPQQTLWHDATALLPTRIHFPDDFDATRPHALIVALHGYGSSAEAFGRVAEKLVGNGFIVAVPQAPYAFLIDGRLGFDWTLFHIGDDTLADRAALPLIREYLPTVVRDISARYPIDDVYVLGFSQGAVMALATAIVNHDLYAGAISFGLPDYRPGWLPEGALASGHDVEILLLHGRQDDRAPFAASEAARDHLSAAGYDVTLRGFNGGHTVPDVQLDYVSRWIRAPEKPSR